MLDTRLRKTLDIPLLALIYALTAIGILALFSATRGDPTAYHKKQMMFVVLGTLGMVAAALLDYHVLQRFTKQIYMLNLVLLAFVLKLAPAVKGATRWIKIAGFPFQPSEFAKLFIIIALAAFLMKRRETIHEAKTLALSLLYVLLPMALIFKQPDLGTALVVFAIWFAMVFMAGASLKHLGLLIVLGGGLFCGMWYSGILSDFQKHRIETFLFPDSDPKGKGYHVLQARIAVGSGGMWGKGLLHSTQVQGGYIPEKQTDFIFTTIGEEFGFVGSILVVFLYALLLLRGTLIIAAADEDLFGKLLATGVVAMLGFHIVENIGMNIGIMPVAGVPLPLISAGGSNMLMTLLCVGLLQSVSLHRHQLLFR